MPRGLVALSASAVAAIYMAGYVRTQSADASIDAIAEAVASPPPAATATQPSTAIPRRGRAAPGASTAQAPAPATSDPATSNPQAPAPAASSPQATTPAPAPPSAPAPSTAQQTQGTYKDGTYSGMGTSRRGNVWVSVTVEGGRVELVSITRSTLQYPVRDIAGLPAQVVARQSAQVNIVSGATYSSQAFRTAVSQALQQAVA
jgi:uncharacterized protein with FMN-binding domain